ncbi:MAG: hypothetical protein AAGC74_10735 [Verrucomicrobiota bacterium]
MIPLLPLPTNRSIQLHQQHTMIQNILYGVTIALAAAATFFGFSNNGKLKEEIVKYEDLYEANLTLGQRIEDEEERVKTSSEALKAANSDRDEAQASLDNEQSKESGLEKSLARVEADIEAYDAELVEVNAAISRAKIIIGEMIPDSGGNLGVDDVAGYIETLENQRKDLEEELDEKTVLAAKLKTAVQSATEQKQRQQERLVKVKQRIARNSVVATVTAVDNGYGFCIINRGSSNSNIDDRSELLVSRGGQYVGKLKVSSLEPTQTICDIDKTSLKPGTRILSGDRVVLKQAVSN